jgi:hypothetical protein
VDRDGFWHIVATARGRRARSANSVARRIIAQLQRRPLDEIVAFGRHYEAVSAESNTHLLWAAAYLINGGCSDDGFDYFRGWLVTRGRDAWTHAVADPDSLVDIVHTGKAARLVRAIRPLECENMLGAAAEAYERVSGDHEAYWAAFADADDAQLLTEPRDDPFDFDDEGQMRVRLPRLTARLLK